MIAAKPRDLAVGEMRDRITIYSETSAINDIGEPVRTWTVLWRDQPAKWIPVAGGETIRGRSYEATITAIFVMHRMDGITPEMKIVHGIDTYHNSYVKPVDGRRQSIQFWLDLQQIDSKPALK